MALKKQFPPLAAFSMSSMTDVIFLLLIFFMVTSTLIFPAAIDVTLPESSEQTTLKPVTEVYVDSISQIWVVPNRTDSIAANTVSRRVSPEELLPMLRNIQAQDSLRAIALYADKRVPYGSVIEILDLASQANLRMVLATKPSKR